MSEAGPQQAALSPQARAAVGGALATASRLAGRLTAAAESEAAVIEQEGATRVAELAAGGSAGTDALEWATREVDKALRHQVESARASCDRADQALAVRWRRVRDATTGWPDPPLRLLA